MDDLEPDFGPPPQGKPKKRKAAEGLTTKSGQVLVIFSRPEKGQEGLDEVRFEGSLCIQSSAGKSVSAEQLQLHLRALQDDWLRSFRATRAKWSVKQKKQHADDLKDIEATSFIWVLSVQRFRVQAQAEGDYVFGQASFVGRQFQPVGSFANVGLLEKIAGVAVDFADGTNHRSCTFRDFCESVQCSTATRQARCLIIPRSVADRALSSDPLDGLLLPESFAKRLQISVSGQLELEEKTKGLPVHMVKATTLSGARDPQVRNHDIPLSVFYGALGHYCQSLTGFLCSLRFVLLCFNWHAPCMARTTAKPQLRMHARFSSLHSNFHALAFHAFALHWSALRLGSTFSQQHTHAAHELETRLFRGSLDGFRGLCCACGSA